MAYVLGALIILAGIGLYWLIMWGIVVLFDEDWDMAFLLTLVSLFVGFMLVAAVWGIGSTISGGLVNE